jgi:alcohol dehydrogenase class IV
MTHSSPSKQTVVFVAPSALFVGELAADALIAELIHRGVEKPCCIIRGDAGKKRAVQRLLKTASPARITMVQASNSPAQDQLESFAEEFTTHGCDGIIAIGNSEVQAFARLLRIRMSLSPEEFATIWQSGVIPDSVEAATPLACLPFGNSDGTEIQTQVWLGEKRFDHHDLLPDLVGIDPRLTGLSTQKEIAANTCTTMLNFITAFKDTDHMIMDSWIACGFGFLQNALQNWLLSTQDNTSWRNISSDMIAAQCLSSVCAYNRGASSIARFVETLAVDGFANRHQSAAALLPVLVVTIQRNSPQTYIRLQEFLDHEDPKRFVEDWIAIANPQGLDHIIQALCIDTYRLFESVNVLRDIKPLLALLAADGTESADPSFTESQRRSL